jgi:VanZ family protein
MKLSHALALYLFWPAVLIVAWGELTPSPPHLVVEVWDKLLHYSAYFGLAGLATVALNARRQALWAVLGLVILGGILEILQGFTGRDPDIYDELANTLGAFTGGAAGWLLMWALSRNLPTVGPDPDAAIH